MCNCIKEVTKQTIDMVKESLSGDLNKFELKEKDCGFDDIGFSLSGGPTRVYMPFEVSYLRYKKNGEQERRLTTKRINIYPTFCPFCGEKYKIEK